MVTNSETNETTEGEVAVGGGGIPKEITTYQKSNTSQAAKNLSSTVKFIVSPATMDHIDVIDAVSYTHLTLPTNREV